MGSRLQSVTLPRGPRDGWKPPADNSPLVVVVNSHHPVGAIGTSPNWLREDVLQEFGAHQELACGSGAAGPGQSSNCTEAKSAGNWYTIQSPGAIIVDNDSRLRIARDLKLIPGSDTEQLLHWLIAQWQLLLNKPWCSYVLAEVKVDY